MGYIGINECIFFKIKNDVYVAYKTSMKRQGNQIKNVKNIFHNDK